MEGERRQHPRHRVKQPADVAVGLVVDSASLLRRSDVRSVELAGRPVDWSAGGLQVELAMEAPWTCLTPAHTLELWLRRPSAAEPAQEVMLKAEVVHNRDNRHLGLKFLYPNPELIEAFFGTPA